MKHIYEGVSQVFIWLGEADEETDLAWHYIEELSDKWQRFVEAPRENPFLRVPDSGTASREASEDAAFTLSAGYSQRFLCLCQRQYAIFYSDHGLVGAGWCKRLLCVRWDWLSAVIAR